MAGRPRKYMRSGRIIAPPSAARRNPDYLPLKPGDVLTVEKGNQRIGIHIYSKLHVVTAERLGADYGRQVRVVVTVSGYHAPTKAINLYVRSEKATMRPLFNMHKGDGINYISVRRT